MSVDNINITTKINKLTKQQINTLINNQIDSLINLNNDLHS